MPQPNKIPLPFAASGDKNTIPESTETTGLASWRNGFPAITSAPFSEGGIAPKRADFNGIFNALSQAVMWLQQGGVYAYDADTDYEAGNVVLDAGGLYVANAANGPSSAVVQPSSDTTGATWKLVRLDLATQTVAGYMSAADKSKLDNILDSPAFTGTPTAPVLPITDNSNKLATTQFVHNYVPVETGTWTPTLAGVTTSGTFTYTTQSGYYARVGKLVGIYGIVAVSACTVAPDGVVAINGLPYTPGTLSRTVSINAWGNGFVANSGRKICLFYTGVGTPRLEGKLYKYNSTGDYVEGYADLKWLSTSATERNVQYTVGGMTGEVHFGGVYLTEDN